MKIKLLKKLILVKKIEQLLLFLMEKNTAKYCHNIFLMKNGIIKELGKYKKI